MNFKTLALGSVIALGSIFGGVQSAEARTCFDILDGEAHLCNSYEYSNAYGDVYTVGYADDLGNQTGMTITCRGDYAVDWKSTGNMSYDYLDTVADYFCALP